MTRYLHLFVAAFMAGSVAPLDAAPLPKLDTSDPDYLAIKIDPSKEKLPDVLRDAQPIDEKYPLPQDPEKSKRLRMERLDWHRNGLLAAFKKTPGASAPWADKARATFESYSHRFTRYQMPATGVYYQTFLSDVETAINAGCDDPMILYWDWRFLRQFQSLMTNKPQDRSEVRKRIRKVHKLLANSPYPPVLKMHTLWNAQVEFEWQNTGDEPATDEEVANIWKEFWAEYRLAAANPHPLIQEQICDLAERVHYTYQLKDKDRKLGWEKVDQALAEAKAPEWTRKVVKGEYLINYAWDARGNGTANTVSEEGWKLFHERLEQAQESLEAAWKLDNTRARPAVEMLTVALGRGFSRDEMEKWFTRAMTADPDSYSACSAKATYLDTCWYGTEKELLDFARQCFRTNNWYAALPYQLFRYYTRHDGGYTGRPGNTRIREVEGWNDVTAFFNAYLARYPDCRYVRSQYAMTAYLTQQLKLADEQFRAIGGAENRWPTVFADAEKYKLAAAQIRKIAESNGIP